MNLSMAVIPDVPTVVQKGTAWSERIIKEIEVPLVIRRKTAAENYFGEKVMDMLDETRDIKYYY